MDIRTYLWLKRLGLSLLHFCMKPLDPILKNPSVLQRYIIPNTVDGQIHFVPVGMDEAVKHCSANLRETNGSHPIPSIVCFCLQVPAFSTPNKGVASNTRHAFQPPIKGHPGFLWKIQAPPFSTPNQRPSASFPSHSPVRTGPARGAMGRICFSTFTSKPLEPTSGREMAGLPSTTVDGRNPAPLSNHGKRSFVGIYKGIIIL